MPKLHYLRSLGFHSDSARVKTTNDMEKAFDITSGSRDEILKN